MHVKQELRSAISISRHDIGAGKRPHDEPVPPQSDVRGKYALLLKYCDKACAAELRLSAFPEDLRERFRCEAVADPSRIEEIVGRLVTEEQRRRSPFGDPQLDTLYQKLGSYGPGAQSEFHQVLELLKGEVDPQHVFAQITGRQTAGMDGRLSNREEGPVLRLVETPQVAEERRRQAKKIAAEIENLRRDFESRTLSTGTEPPEKAKLLRRNAAESNRPGEAVEPATSSEDRPAVGSSCLARSESAVGPATALTVGMPAISHPEQRKLPVASISAKTSRSAPSLAAAAIAVAVMSGAGLALMAPPTGAGSWPNRHTVADTSRQTVQEEAASREAAARVAEAKVAALRVAEEKARTEEVEKTAAAQKLSAEAAARREEEARQASRKEDKVQFEAARQMAEPEGRAAAQEVERRQAAENDVRRAADAAESRTIRSLPKPEVAARQQAENAEAGLNLSEQDRKRVQVALTALGHPIPTTGYFGPITRAMIADWQRTQGLPPSSFLDSSQLAALYAQAASSLEVYDQRKLPEPRNGS